MSTHTINDLALIHKGAEVDSDVSVGPYSVIGENVRIGKGTVIGPHVVISGWTEIGENCQISPHAVIGEPPQHHDYHGERSYVKIGNNNIIREYVTVHRSMHEEKATIVGNDNFFMACSHVAHDCVIGDQVTVTNYVGISGHVTVEDKVVLGGHSGVHQFVRLGTLCMVGGYSRVIKDIPPYIMAEGNPARVKGLNVIGLRRADIGRETRSNIKKAYKLLYLSGLNTTQALTRIKEEINMENEIAHFVQLIEESERGICA